MNAFYQFMKVWIVIWIVFTLSSCYRGFAIPDDRKNDLSYHQLKRLNGSYENFAWVDTSHQKLRHPGSLGENLPGFVKNKKANYDFMVDSTSRVDITVIDHKRVRFAFSSQGQIIRSRVFKYRYSNGGLEIGSWQNKYWQGFPLIFYRHCGLTLRLALDHQNNLLLSCNGSVSGGILILVFGMPEYGVYRFRRLPDSPQNG